MANELVTFARGLSTNVPSAKTAGRIILETDTGNMYVDTSSSERVQIKDDTKVLKDGDTLTGPLYFKMTSSTMPSYNSNYSGTKGFIGILTQDNVEVPVLWGVSQNSNLNNTAIGLSGNGLTIIGAGENGFQNILKNAYEQSGTSILGNSTYITPSTEELILTTDDGISFFPGGETASPTIRMNADGVINSSVQTGTHLNAAAGKSIINATSSGFTMLATMNSTNGKFYLGSYGDSFKLHYRSNSSETNTPTKLVTLLNESGEASFPGTVTVSTPTSSTHATTKAYVDDLFSGYHNKRRGEFGKTNQSAEISGTTANNWQKIAEGELTGNADINILFLVTDNYTHANGLLSLGIRTSNGVAQLTLTDPQGPRLEWISRHTDINPQQYRLRIKQETNGNTNTKALWYLECEHHRRWYATTFEVLEDSGNVGNSNTPDYTLYTDGPSVATDGTVFTSDDVIPLGGTWNSSTLVTDNAKGIAIGQYEGCLADSLSIAIGGSKYFPTSALSLSAIAMGYGTHASGSDAIAIGNGCTADAFRCCAIGSNAEAHGTAETIPYTNGNGMSVKGHSIAMGYTAVAQANSSTAIGNKTQAVDFGSFVCGFSNSPTAAANRRTSGLDATKGNVFIVGNGTYKGEASSLGYNMSNAFRVTTAGAVYAKAAYNSSGADYAEFIKEWYDGNVEKEDRVGYMVTIGADGKLHKANAGDYILGITSGNPSVVGNADEDYLWKYERDVFNRPIIEEHEEKNIKMDEEGNPVTDESGNIIYETTGTIIHNFKLRSDYDPSQQESYIERKDRPEWDYVGMRGIVPCRDDGTCVAGGFCKCGENGIATYASQQDFNTYYVIERLSENVVSVEVK